MPSSESRSSDQGDPASGVHQSDVPKEAGEVLRRKLVVYDEADVAWTTRAIKDKVSSGVPSFVRRTELNFLSDEPSDQNLTLDEILDLAEASLRDLSTIAGIDTLKVLQWGLTWTAPGPHRWFARAPGKLTAEEYALVAEVPVIENARPLTDEE